MARVLMETASPSVVMSVVEWDDICFPWSLEGIFCGPDLTGIGTPFCTSVEKRHPLCTHVSVVKVMCFKSGGEEG